MSETWPALSGLTAGPSSGRAPPSMPASIGSALPRAMAAREKAPAAANANRRPREAESWMRKPRARESSAADGTRSGAGPRNENCSWRGDPEPSRPLPSGLRRSPITVSPDAPGGRGGPSMPSPPFVPGRPWSRASSPAEMAGSSEPGDHALEPPLLGRGGLALRTGRQMGEHPVAAVVGQLTVDERGEPVAEVLLGGRRAMGTLLLA